MTMCPKALLLESWGGRGVAENLKNGGGGGEMGYIESGVCRHVNPEGVCRK